MAHYHLWRLEPMPVFLVLFDPVRRRAFWLYLQAYFARHPPPKPEARSLTLRIPRKNRFGKSTITITKMQQHKAEVLQQIEQGRQPHD
jgi:hypothetical protein